MSRQQWDSALSMRAVGSQTGQTEQTVLCPGFMLGFFCGFIKKERALRYSSTSVNCTYRVHFIRWRPCTLRTEPWPLLEVKRCVIRRHVPQLEELRDKY